MSQHPNPAGFSTFSTTGCDPDGPHLHPFPPATLAPSCCSSYPNPSPNLQPPSSLSQPPPPSFPNFEVPHDVENGFNKFRAKFLPDSGSRSTVAVLCEIDLDGIKMLDPSTGRMLKIYLIENITRCCVVDSSTFEFWSKSSMDIEPTRIMLQLNSCTANIVLDTVAAATVQVKGLADWMNLIEPLNEEKDHSTLPRIRPGVAQLGKRLLSRRLSGDDLGIKSMANLRIKGTTKHSAKSILNRTRTRKMIDIKMQQIRLLRAGIIRNVPPYNSAATDPKEVYPLARIIRAGDWRHLKDILGLIERGEEVSRDAYPDFVSQSIKKLKETEDKAKRDTLGCILSFITHLVKFKDKEEGYISEKDHSIPPVLYRRFSDLFIVPESGLIHLHLVMCYILVLCLFVEDFRTHPAYISQDLRRCPLDVNAYYEHLGCKFSGNFAELRIPVVLRDRRTCF